MLGLSFIKGTKIDSNETELKTMAPLTDLVKRHEDKILICDCNTEYVISFFCTDINECSRNPCLNGGTCLDRVNGFNCSCPSGYKGSRCENGQ